MVVHLISFLPSRQAEGLDIVHDPFPIVDMPISVRTEKQPESAWLQPHWQRLPFEYGDGYTRVRVTLTDGHGMLVLKM